MRLLGSASRQYDSCNLDYCVIGERCHEKHLFMQLGKLIYIGNISIMMNMNKYVQHYNYSHVIVDDSIFLFYMIVFLQDVSINTEHNHQYKKQGIN